jgi:hypothetical protein
MKQSTKDELEGRLHEAKGKVKEKVGQVTSNPDTETKGDCSPERIVRRNDSCGNTAHLTELGSPDA